MALSMASAFRQQGLLSQLAELKEQPPGRGIAALSALCVCRKCCTTVRNLWSKSASVSLNSSVEFLECNLDATEINSKTSTDFYSEQDFLSHFGKYRETVTPKAKVFKAARRI